MSHQVNRGYGAALWTGLTSATKKLVFMTDGDKQFDAREAALFLPHIQDADLVIGYRAPRLDPPMRLLNAWGWNLLVRLLFGYVARDVDCAFKLFRRSVLEKVRVESESATLSAEFLIKARRYGYRIVEMRATHYPRTVGMATGAKLSVILRAFRELIKLRISVSPLSGPSEMPDGFDPRGLYRDRQTTMKQHVLMLAIIIVLATGAMGPRLVQPAFGLLDDGVTVGVSQGILDGPRATGFRGILSIEKERGRFRPMYWLYYIAQYSIWGENAAGFFVVQWLTFMLTAIAIWAIVGIAAQDWLAGVLSAATYILAPPMAENYYTLSKPEPPLVLWLALSMVFLFAAVSPIGAYRKRGKFLLAASLPPLFVAYFTKETAVVMVVISGLWLLAALPRSVAVTSKENLKIMAGYFAANLVFAAAYWVARNASGTIDVAGGTDSGNYVVTLETIRASIFRYLAWYVRDFPQLFPILGLALVIILTGRGSTSFRGRGLLVCCLLWLAGWTAIMLPWHSVLEYYLLPVTLGASIITGIGLSAAFKHLNTPARLIRVLAGATLICVLLLAPPLLANSYTNARVQVAVDASNAGLIDYLSSSAPRNTVVLVNVPDPNVPDPNEYEFEIGAHLRFIKHRQDVQVHYLSNFIRPEGSYVLVATPVMVNQPFPSVRIAVDEGGSALWNRELLDKLGNDARPSYENIRRVPLLMVGIEKPLCALIKRWNVQAGQYCGAAVPVIDTRVFQYGWKVYQVNAKSAPNSEIGRD